MSRKVTPRIENYKDRVCVVGSRSDIRLWDYITIPLGAKDQIIYIDNIVSIDVNNDIAFATFLTEDGIFAYQNKLKECYYAPSGSKLKVKSKIVGLDRSVNYAEQLIILQEVPENRARKINAML